LAKAADLAADEWPGSVHVTPLLVFIKTVLTGGNSMWQIVHQQY